MSKCVNPELGALLHAYEIGILPDEDREKFEIHLIECGRCRDEAQRFELGSSLIRHDDGFREIAKQAIKHQAVRTGFLKKVLSSWWPDLPFFFKPAVGFAVIMLMLLFRPVYMEPMLGLAENSAQVGFNGHELILATMRSISIPTVKSDLPISINIPDSFNNGIDSSALVVLTIRQKSPDSIVFYSRFYRYSQKLRIPANGLKPGTYQLIIEDPSGKNSFPPRLFRVK